MSDDRFFEQLRRDAARLQFTPADETVWTRLGARIRESIHRPNSVSQMLARWFRPITASFVMLAIAAGLTMTWVDQAHESSYAAEAMASHPVEITVDGATFSLNE
jgi:hypothetical protein